VIPDDGVAEIEAEDETAGTVVLDHATGVERRIEAGRPFRSRERCSWPADAERILREEQEARADLDESPEAAETRR
jgi:hypothetical protein